MLVPFVHFSLRLQPVGQITPVFTIALLPELVSPLGNLFFQADVLVHPENRCGGLVGCFVFHGVNSCQKAKQSQPDPKKPA